MAGKGGWYHWWNQAVTSVSCEPSWGALMSWTLGLKLPFLVRTAVRRDSKGNRANESDEVQLGFAAVRIDGLRVCSCLPFLSWLRIIGMGLGLAR